MQVARCARKPNKKAKRGEGFLLAHLQLQMLLLISTHVVKDLEFLKNEDDKVHQISNVEK